MVEWSDDEVILSLGGVSGAGRTVRYARTQAQTMRILADASSLEIFINHGETVLTTRYYPDPAARGVVLDGGTAQPLEYKQNGDHGWHFPVISTSSWLSTSTARC